MCVVKVVVLSHQCCGKDYQTIRLSPLMAVIYQKNARGKHAQGNIKREFSQPIFSTNELCHDFA